MPTTSRRRVVASVLAAVLLVGCGGAASPDDAGGEPQAEIDMDQRPDPAAELPEEGTAPPDGLGVQDLVVGEGAEAGAGDTVTVHYVGVGWDSRQEFDASWGGQPFTFQLGSGMVIPGWDQGVEGMREGGRRRLIIPADLAYGDRGVEGRIGPGETLVFDVDLLDVQG